MRPLAPAWALCLGAVLAAGACGRGTLDAGNDVPHGPIPQVDERNPIIVSQDDWQADWLGELAILFASTGRSPIKGIIVNATPFWKDLEANVRGWRDMLAAARDSGLKNLPEVTPSASTPLTRPTNGQIKSTTPNRSDGAKLIVSLSSELSRPNRPVVVVSATSLTDLADAYLMDNTVVDRVVVVAALGLYKAPKGIMASPNGDMDPWADWIVTQTYRFVQVGVHYNQLADVPEQNLSDLPMNPFGAFMAMQQPKILDVDSAADQVALVAVADPLFVTGIQRAAPDLSAGFNTSQGPDLVPADDGRCWLVTSIVGTLPASRMWPLLRDPKTFAN